MTCNSRSCRPIYAVRDRRRKMRKPIAMTQWPNSSIIEINLIRRISAPSRCSTLLTRLFVQLYAGKAPSYPQQAQMRKADLPPPTHHECFRPQPQTKARLIAPFDLKLQGTCAVRSLFLQRPPINICVSSVREVWACTSILLQPSRTSS